MKDRIDLHLHTTCSDGLTTPAELLDKVRKRKLTAFAITDHDTIDGYLQTRRLLAKGDPELVAGVELSCSSDESDLHILAYQFDPEAERLRTTLENFRQNRTQRGRVIVQKLKDMGVEIDYEDVVAVAGEATMGRPHVAEALYRRKAVVTYEDAFRRYISNRGPAYVAKTNFTPPEAIAMIHASGGVAVLAHPMIDGAIERLEELVSYGLDGVEAMHPDQKEYETVNLKAMAKRFRLIWTGGSDFHGRSGRCGAVGSEAVPMDCLGELRKRASHKPVLQKRGKA